MTYKGVEGLYLYYKTLDVTFEDVRTLTNIEGKDINGEDVDFINDTLPSVSKAGGVLTAADTVAKNTPEDDDLSFTIKVNKDEYRIPTEDVIHVRMLHSPTLRILQTVRLRSLLTMQSLTP